MQVETTASFHLGLHLIHEFTSDSSLQRYQLSHFATHSFPIPWQLPCTVASTLEQALVGVFGTLAARQAQIRTRRSPSFAHRMCIRFTATKAVCGYLASTRCCCCSASYSNTRALPTHYSNAWAACCRRSSPSRTRPSRRATSVCIYPMASPS